MSGSDLRHLLSKSGSVLLSGVWSDSAGCQVLHTPCRVLSTEKPDEIRGLLDEVRAETDGGNYVAGYLSYEAGAAFDLAGHAPIEGMPLAWFAVYPSAHVGTASSSDLRALVPCEISEPEGLHLSLSEAEYAAGVDRIKDLIAAGDTYQVNYTCHASFDLKVDPLAYFAALVRSHPVPYAAYLNIGDAQILSLSPELFLRKRGEMIETLPMKGTRRRGRTNDEDEELARQLVMSEKDRAENVMILDMMRNDLGRICRTGSVRVPAMFKAEKYRSVWQMTSTASGAVPPEVSIGEITAATFPASSITGAPKQRTMEIIRELEAGPRGVYTGAICLFMPNGDFTCNVAIRTLVHRDGHFDLGIGSGIVWDSNPQDEYAETLLKAQFALSPLFDMRLFETLLLDEAGQYAFEAEHAERMARSAAYWDFVFDATEFHNALNETARHASDLPLRVHVELDDEGEFTVESAPLPDPPSGPVKIVISSLRTDSTDRLLYHKTTERQTYARSLEQARKNGFFEVIFLNENGDITEGAITNIFVRMDDEWLTPPIADGMLPGIWRESYLRETCGREMSITLDDLAVADEIVIGNSVRGVIPVAEIYVEGTEQVFRTTARVRIP